MEQSWGMDLVRSFFATIDKAVYGLMSTIYQIILDLANATIISSDLIEDLYTRMYALLGIFMFFKVTFSFVNYLINPDSFTDKAKGVQNLVKNIIIVLVMIIITPFAFDKLYEAQNAIIGDNLIPNFILGVNGVSSDDKTIDGYFKMSDRCPNYADVKTDADYLSLVTFRPFYQLEVDADFSKILDEYCSTNASLTPQKVLESDIYNKSSENKYIVNYKFFVSTMVGIVVCLILISFCFDIAVRSIKLAFLQMIAPIPIISYIDPASSKNGVFSKWLKQVGSTWVSLFVRLVALFFAVLVISKLDVDLSGSEHQFWVMLFILIGALMFAKQVPKLLEELFPGLKLGGGMQLNPFKKVANEALGGKALLGLGAGAVGLGIGASSWLGRQAVNKIKNGAEDREKNLADRVALAEQRYGVNSAQANKLVDKWEKAAEQVQAKNRRLEEKTNKRQSLTDLRGRLHVDEMALHPVTNTMKSLLGALTSMGDAAKSGYKQGSSMKFNPIQMGVDSSKEQDRRDKYNAYERTKDTMTDFFGIKNESGTTSKVKEDIKEQTENLRKIQSTLSSMEHSFANMQQRMGSEFSKAFTYNADTKRFVYDNSYNGPFAAEAKQFSDTIAKLDKEYSTAKKNLGRLEGQQKTFSSGK